jgi:hypothetical protein
MKKQKSQTSQHTEQLKVTIDYGIDISMLKDNLKRTPAERIRRHQIALNTVKKLRKAEQI